MNPRACQIWYIPDHDEIVEIMTTGKDNNGDEKVYYETMRECVDGWFLDEFLKYFEYIGDLYVD